MIGELAEPHLARLQRLVLAGMENGEPHAPAELDPKLELRPTAAPVRALREGEDAGANRRAVCGERHEHRRMRGELLHHGEVLLPPGDAFHPPAVDVGREDRLAGFDHAYDRMLAGVGGRRETAELAEV